jgi:predicted AAA+ superfamily ATPase
MISIRTEDFVKSTSEIVYKKLLEGAIKNENVWVYGLRGIGKTTALIQLAKEFGFIVVVKSHILAHYLRDEFEYDYIFGEKDNITGLGKSIVFDEGVDYKKLKKDGYKIVTGLVLEVE